MKYKVEYSKKSLTDLNKVWEEVYKASKNINTTSKYINGIMDLIDNKSDFPKSGSPLCYGDLFTGYYYIIYKAYMVFYRVENDIMLIDRILFGKSNYISKLNIK